MAIEKLSINFKDDIINTVANEHKKYKLTDLGDNVFSFEDKTEYIQKGTVYNAQSVNETNAKVNELIDFTEEVSSDVVDLLSGDKTINRSEKCNTAINSNHAITSNSADSINNDFILINQQSLSFDTNKECKLYDTRITDRSVADVYFTSDTMPIAESSEITVESFSGYVLLKASISPSATIKATIRVRVI